ncbi:MAG TPA: hypothetical protein PLJ47_02730 [Candidatus Hydrogenedentes bacterium]|nr:hypothetical protein [Candidatus Hydrogenedentota bacterium]
MNNLPKIAVSPMNYLVLSLFLFILAVPLIGYFFQLELSPPIDEKRELNIRPEWGWSLEKLDTWPGQFESYFNDHFGFRNSLIRANSQINTRVLGVSPDPEIAIGKGFWLYFKPGQTAFDIRRVAPFPESELDAWKQVIQSRAKWLAERNILFVIAIIPDKHTIYPEYLPTQLAASGDRSRLDELKAAVQSTESLLFIDLRPSLTESKDAAQNYFKYDTHWNAFGALTAIETITTALKTRFPAIPVPNRANFDLQMGTKTGDLAVRLALDTSISEEMPILAYKTAPQARESYDGLHPIDYFSRSYFATEVPGGTLPRAVVMRDSFFTEAVPFWSECFSRSVYVWSDVFDPNLIEQESPDVLVWAVCERKLMDPAPVDYLLDSRFAELDNLVMNGNFEVGQNGEAYWLLPPPDSGITISKGAEAESREGKGSLRVSAQQNSNVGIRQEILTNITPGGRYVLRGQVRAEATTGTTRIEVHDLRGFQVFMAATQGVVGQEGWWKQDVTFQLPADCTGVQVLLRHIPAENPPDGAITLWFDDVQLREIPAVSQN